MLILKRFVLLCREATATTTSRASVRRPASHNCARIWTLIRAQNSALKHLLLLLVLRARDDR